MNERNSSGDESDTDDVGWSELAGTEPILFRDSKREVADRTRGDHAGKGAKERLFLLAQASGLHHEAVGEPDPFPEVVHEGEAVAPGRHEDREADHQRPGGEAEADDTVVEIAPDQGDREPEDHGDRSGEDRCDQGEHRDREQEVRDMDGGKSDEPVHEEAGLGVGDREQGDLEEREEDSKGRHPEHG